MTRTDKKPNTRRWRRAYFRALAVPLAILAVLSLLVADSSVRLVRREFETPLAGLDPVWDGLRITVVSDLHGQSYGPGNRRLTETVAAAKPDLIAITGDLFDAPDQLDRMVETVSSLLTLAPVYYVTGNHEWATGMAEEAMDRLADLGVTVLDNRVVRLEKDGAGLLLCGVADKNAYAEMPSPADVMARARVLGTEPTVLLAHRYTELAVYAQAGFDLVLCGHGHGGVIRLPFLGGLLGPGGEWRPENIAGLVTVGDTLALVSRGLAPARGLPRFLNNPEVVTAVLRAA